MKTVVFISCFLILLSACGPSPEQQAAMTATAQTATAAAWTPTPTSTNTPTPTLTPTPTQTPTPTLTPTITSSPTPTRDPQRYYAPDDSFSIMIPEGWETQDFNMKYLGFIGPRVGDGNPNILFGTEKNDSAFLLYSSALQAMLKKTDPNLNVLSEDFLVTPEGLEYLRVVIEYTLGEVSVHQIYYIFQNGDTKFMVVYTRSQAGGEEIDPQIDKIIYTLQFEP